MKVRVQPQQAHQKNDQPDKQSPKPSAETFFLKGALVWYKSKPEAWLPGLIDSQKGKQVVLHPLNDEGQPDTKSEETVSVDDVLPIQTPTLPPSVSDMVSLGDLNEPSMLHNLRARYRTDTIYTYVGPILVSLNPNKQLPIYGPDVIQQYLGKAPNTLPPHIYALTENTYRHMTKDKKNQSILISGESGTGKTEGARFIMRYLASVTREEGKVEKQLLEAHPIMEAFGNAKTIQNNNSSRFGKFFQIHFHSNGSMAGAVIDHYLLEKSRIVSQAQDERNYHIFYQFLSGANAEEKEKYFLLPANKYTFLNTSGCVSIEGVDDSKNFADVKRAMSVLTMSPEEQDGIFRMLSAILHLGNLNISKDTARNDAAFVTNPEVLQIIANQIGSYPMDLETALCSRNMSARAQSVYTIPLKMDEACSTRDALAKALYDKLFDWIIKKINTTLIAKSSNNFIGILDIFGFESFEINSFEQLCINYANEKLQQHFTKHLFQVEQEEYIKEKINWGKIDFEDNIDVVDLFEKKPLGLLSILDEECNFPKGSDQSFLDKVSKNFDKSKVFKKNFRSQSAFTILHFAGEVNYETSGFLVKNKDTIYGDLIQLMEKSNDFFVQTLFPAEKKDKKVVVRPGQPAAKKVTLGTQFKEQLIQLMNIISSTEPHFIRAIKPNNMKKANCFEGAIAVRQLRYSGLLETVRIRAAGFLFRPTYEECFKRFKILVKDINSLTSGMDYKRRCEVLLLDHLKVDKSRVQFGITKLFMKENEFSALNKECENKMKESVVKIQRIWRSFYMRLQFVKKRKSVLDLQTAIRGINAKKEYKKLKREKEKELREKRAKEEQEKEKQRLEKERQDKLSKEKEEKERKEREQKEKLEREKQEKQRLENEEKERKERELKEKKDRELKEKLEREKLEKQRLEEQEKKERERREKEREEFERRDREEKERKDREVSQNKEDIYSLDLIISNDVLEWEVSGLEEKIAAAKASGSDVSELVSRKQALEIKLKNLTNQAENGMLDPKLYLRALKERVAADKKLAGKLSKEGNKEDALIVLKRSKIMEKEIEETEISETPEIDQGFAVPSAPSFPIVPNGVPSEPAFPVAPTHNPTHNLPTAPKSLPGGELTIEKPKKNQDSDLKSKLEASIQNAIENPELRTNPLKVLKDINVPESDPGTSDEEFKLKKKNEDLEKQVKDLESKLKKAQSDTESEKVEASVQKRLLEEEKKKQVKVSKDMETKIRLEEQQKLKNELETQKREIEKQKEQFLKEKEENEKKILDLKKQQQQAKKEEKKEEFVPPSQQVFASKTVTNNKPLDKSQDRQSAKISDPVSYPNLSKMVSDFESKPPVSVAPIPVVNERPPSTNFTYGLNLYSSQQVQQVQQQQPEVKPAIDMPISTFYPATFEAPVPKVNETPVVEAEPVCELTPDELRNGLKFEMIQKTAALAIPQGKGVTKYDYSKAKSEPFSFKSIDKGPEIEEKAQSIEVSDEFENMEEPEHGTHPESLDIESHIKERESLPFIPYRPVFYKFPKDLEPLRPPDKFAAQEKLEGLENLAGGDTENVTYIRIVDTPLQKDQKKTIAKSLSLFKKTQVLILRKVGLENKQISAINLPDLRYLDVSQNVIADVTPILECLQRSENIEIAILSDNPACFKPAFRERIIAACPSLRRINDKEIDTEERIRAIDNHGNKDQVRKIGFMRWDLTFSALPELTSMNSWDPENITKLNFSNTKLTQFHIGTLVHLEELDLSHNQINILLGTGVEQASHLKKLNVSHNRITSKRQLLALQFVSSLRYLHLEGNRDTQKDLKDYRNFVIFITRHLKGTNRCTGLIELDGSPVSLEERINAVGSHSKKKNDHHIHRWNLNLMDYYGHHQMRTPNFLSSVRHLKLANSGLATIDLRGLFSLEVLDLSGNFLEKLEGLKELPKLRFLNLSGNPKLDLSHTLDQLHESMFLEQVSFAVVDESHKLHFNNKKYREKILTMLLPTNIHLRFVDNIWITPQERVDILKILKSKEEAEQYRFQLALVMNTTMPQIRKYHYTETEYGIQYNPTEITSLRRMNNFELTFCDFRLFINLEELNLSGNLITDLNNLGLDELKKLRVLDVTNNQIDMSLKDLASFLDKMSTLECIALRGNPCMKSESDRKKLIGLMTTMREVTCVLQVIDTVVTIDERIDAWKSNGGSEDEAELIRYKAIMFQRMPRDQDPAQMTCLDLNDAGFAKVDVRKFQNLEVLLLKGNALTSLDDTGISSLSSTLKVLDLRDNKLPKMEEIVSLVRMLPKLTTLGIGNNKCTDSKNWRIKFLSLLPELHQKHCALRKLDDTEIGVEECVEAWKLSKDNSVDPKNYRFHVITYLKLPEKNTSAIQELDFSNCGVTNVDVSQYTKLKKLSLASNEIKSLEESNLRSLSELEGLDISGNKLKDLDSVIGVLKDLSRLKVVYMDKNPCFETDEEDTRIKFLAKYMSFYDPTNMTLISLNGKPITVQEKCRAFKKMKNPSFDPEEKRVELAFVERNVEQDHSILDLSGFEFSTINGIQNRCPKVTQLSINNNNLKTLELEVFKSYPNLVYLDISNNQLPSIQHILDVLSSCCPQIETLIMINATKSKETALPREYAFKVCKVLRNLMTVDGLKNPFGTMARRKPELKRTPTVMRMAESMQEMPQEQEQQAVVGKYNYDLTSIYKDVQNPMESWVSMYKPVAPPPSDNNSGVVRYG